MIKTKIQYLDLTDACMNYMSTTGTYNQYLTLVAESTINRVLKHGDIRAFYLKMRLSNVKEYNNGLRLYHL